MFVHEAFRGVERSVQEAHPSADAPCCHTLYSADETTHCLALKTLSGKNSGKNRTGSAAGSFRPESIAASFAVST